MVLEAQTKKREFLRKRGERVEQARSLGIEQEDLLANSKYILNYFCEFSQVLEINLQLSNLQIFALTLPGFET